jgi:hypothetical protein
MGYPSKWKIVKWDERTFCRILLYIAGSHYPHGLSLGPQLPHELFDFHVNIASRSIITAFPIHEKQSTLPSEFSHKNKKESHYELKMHTKIEDCCHWIQPAKIEQYSYKIEWAKVSQV